MLIPVEVMDASRRRPPLNDERRCEKRHAALGHLWMIDGRNGSIIRCRCVDMTDLGMRLRAPIGFGIHEGQTYELCSHLPGQCAPPGLELMISRRATVMWTEIVIDGHADFVDLGVALDAQPRRVGMRRLAHA